MSYSRLDAIDAVNVAEEIGRAAAEDGRHSVMPWAKCYNYWAGAAEVLGLDTARHMAEAAFIARKNELGV